MISICILISRPLKCIFWLNIKHQFSETFTYQNLYIFTADSTWLIHHLLVSKMIKIKCSFLSQNRLFLNMISIFKVKLNRPTAVKVRKSWTKEQPGDTIFSSNALNPDFNMRIYIICISEYISWHWHFTWVLGKNQFSSGIYNHLRGHWQKCISNLILTDMIM